MACCGPGPFALDTTIKTTIRGIILGVDVMDKVNKTVFTLTLNFNRPKYLIDNEVFVSNLKAHDFSAVTV